MKRAEPETSPAARRNDTRDRMIRTAVVLLQENGASSVTVDAVLERSGAPRGSVYHHFPGGRSEMIEAAVQYASEFSRAQFDAIAETGDPVGAISAMCGAWIDQLQRTDFKNGCPIVAVAIENDDRLVDAEVVVQATFSSWRTTYAGLLRRSGVPAKRSKSLANIVVAALEGAIVLARADQDAAPLRAVRAELTELIRAAVPSE